MKTMFYFYVTRLTEWITGLNHMNLTMEELEQYILTSNNVTVFLNVSCMAFIGFISLALYCLVDEMIFDWKIEKLNKELYRGA